MADAKKKLIGRLICGMEVGKRVADIELPQDSNVLVIKASDFETTETSFYNSKRPLMATETIEYPYQVICAIFSDDEDKVLTYLAKANEAVGSKQKEGISVNSAIEDAKTTLVDNTEFRWGEITAAAEKDTSHVSSTFVVRRHTTAALSDIRVRAWEQGGKLHIETPTQWPKGLRNAVCEAFGFAPEKLYLHCLDYEDKYDEYLHKPTQMAIIAAFVCQKTGRECEITSQAMSTQPELEFTIESTVIDKALDSITVNAKADLGAFPRLTDEYMQSIIAGIVPSYSFNAIDVKIEIYSSNNIPGCLYSDLGFGPAQSAMENHITKVAESLGVKPSEWRKEHLGKNQLAKIVRKSTLSGNLTDCLSTCLEGSWYDRQYVANSQKAFFGKGVNPFNNYSRGIGIACGEGISGFSSKFANLDSFSVEVSIDEKEKVTINSGMYLDYFTEKTLKNIAERTLGTDNVGFMDINDEKCVDLGPAVLSRKSRYLPLLVDTCCNKLADIDERPNTVAARYNPGEQKNVLYYSESCACIAIALHIDSVMLSPIIDHIWVTVAIGKTYDDARLKSKIRQKISSTISEICPSSRNTHAIDLKVSEVSNQLNGSITSLIRGLTISAFTTAMNQALSYEVTRVPLRDRDIFGIINKYKANTENKEEEKKAEEKTDEA